MRFVVLLVGLLAIPLTAIAGVAFILIDVVLKWLVENVEGFEMPMELTTYSSASLADAGLFLILAALYGFIGVVLSLMRCGWQGALLLIIPVICTTIMNPLTAGATGLQVFAGLLSFLVFPVPINPSNKNKDDDEDDED